MPSSTSRYPWSKFLTLDQIYEWHRIHSTDIPTFVYHDEHHETSVTWGRLGAAIEKSIKIIQNTIDGGSYSQETNNPAVVAILSDSDTLTYTAFILAHLRLTHSTDSQSLLPFLLSTRNSAIAIAGLLKAKNAKYLWVTEGPMEKLAQEALLSFNDDPPRLLAFPKFSELYTDDIKTYNAAAFQSQE
ncbi:hypothetical protein M422DRAFT_249684, partial [Sphaerobolus stellatus SS14]